MDYEDFFEKISDLIKTNLDNEIDAMNARKTDLKIIKPQAWYQESLDDKAKSYTHFAFIGTSSVNGTMNGRAVAMQAEIEIDYFLPDAQDQLIQKRIKRINHCLMKAAQNSWNKIAGVSNIEISILSPINAGLNNGSRTYKLLAITVKFVMVYN